MRVHHIGYLVKQMDPAIHLHEGLGYHIEQGTQYDPYRKINICFLHNENTRVELIEPVSEQSLVAGVSKRLGIGPYHICYQVPNLSEAIRELQEKRYVVVATAAPAVALKNRPVAFMFHAKVGLIELLEE